MLEKNLKFDGLLGRATTSQLVTLTKLWIMYSLLYGVYFITLGIQCMQNMKVVPWPNAGLAFLTLACRRFSLSSLNVEIEKWLLIYHEAYNMNMKPTTSCIDSLRLINVMRVQRLLYNVFWLFGKRWDYKWFLIRIDMLSFVLKIGQITGLLSLSNFQECLAESPLESKKLNGSSAQMRQCSGRTRLYGGWKESEQFSCRILLIYGNP